ncbi:MAG: hypothetical protein AB2A00_40550 [Myxococcota bacterium]
MSSWTLRPFMVGHARVCERLLRANPLPEMRFLDVLAPETLPFFHLLNAANHVAFGGMGMPAWVQLDCCTLPTAMIGYAIPRHEIPEDTWGRLVGAVSRNFGEPAARALQGYNGLVPVSEYCALPTWEEGTLVGFSLFTLLRGEGLGARTKALALRCYNARVQIGITQYTNSAIRTHTLLGPLRIAAPQAWPHTRPEDTFVYELTIPSTQVLDALVRDGVPPDRQEPAYEFEVVAEPLRTALEVTDLQKRHGPLEVVWPGLARKGGQSVLRLRRAR